MEYIEFIKEIFNGSVKILEKNVKIQKCSGIIYVPKKLEGKRAIVVIPDED